MKPAILGGLALTAVLFAGPAVMAGGDFGAPAHLSCRYASDAADLVSYQSVRTLRGEVYSRYEHAAEVARSDHAIHSLSPLFVWANEAKASCAKVYGYLRKPRKWRKRPDYVMLQKCDCFYRRMTHYLGR